MSKLNVCVIFGGYSNEHEVSLASAENIISNLSAEKYNIIPVYICEAGNWYLYEGSVSDIVKAKGMRHKQRVMLPADRGRNVLLKFNENGFSEISIDVVFPVLLGKFGEDGTIQSLFEMAGLKYTGCGVLSSAICMDKIFTNKLAERLGIALPKYLYFTATGKRDLAQIINEVENTLGYPCFVKAVRSGSSIGTIMVKSKTQLEDAIAEAFTYDSKIIIEEFIEGQELKCALMDFGDGNVEASEILEITIPQNKDFFDFEAKNDYDNKKTYIPANIPREVAEEIREWSVKIFKEMDCNGLARIDFFWVKSTGKVIFNEVNTFPALSSRSNYQKLVTYAGYQMSDILDKMIEVGLKRDML